MNVFITGGTGFVGRALAMRLRRDGDTVTVLTRDPDRAKSQLGREVEYLDAGSGDAVIRAALERSGAVVNLAGEPLIGSRWTAEKKRRLWESRVGFTNDLVEHLGSISAKPSVLVSASAVGFYGDRSETELSEEAPPGHGFLSQLCREWEAAALKATKAGMRVVTPRLGVVLGPEEGALSKMLPAFRAGVGGPVGSGEQFVPWIHVDDLVELLVEMIRNERYTGALNATAPTPVRFGEFAKTLGEELSRPTVLPVPSFALRAVLGEAAMVLLDSQRAVPEKAEALGFRFSYPSLRDALSDILVTGDVRIEVVDEPVPQAPYLSKRPPAYVLKARETLGRPLDEVFEFFSRPENLGLITPPGMHFRMQSDPPAMNEGAKITYKLRVGPVPISWTTRIDDWQEGARFVDVQTKGPYACWWHEHAFEAEGENTVMTDRVFYAPPAGALGRLVNSFFIADELRRVFAYRLAVMRRRFGTSGSTSKEVRHSTK